MTTIHPFERHVEPGEAFDRAAYETAIAQSYLRHVEAEKLKAIRCNESVGRAVVALERMRNPPRVESPTEQPETVTATTTAQKTNKERFMEYIRSRESFEIYQAARDLNISLNAAENYLKEGKAKGLIRAGRRNGLCKVYHATQ